MGMKGIVFASRGGASHCVQLINTERESMQGTAKPLRSFEVELKGSVKTFLERAEKIIVHENGGRFSGDRNRGSFSVFGVQGRYWVKDGSVHITIQKKPVYIPWSLLESKIVEFFG
jgi:hypothetical protein